MPQSKVIYLGIKGTVIAMDAATGQRLWATNFLTDLSIDVTDYTFANGVVGKLHVTQLGHARFPWCHCAESARQPVR